MKFVTRILICLVTAFAVMGGTHNAAIAAPKKEFNIAWTIYVGRPAS
jgi:hypothetical protein